MYHTLASPLPETHVPDTSDIVCSWSPSPGSPFKLDAQLGPDPAKCAMGGPALQTNAILQVGAAADHCLSTLCCCMCGHSDTLHGPVGLMCAY